MRMLSAVFLLRAFLFLAVVVGLTFQLSACESAVTLDTPADGGSSGAPDSGTPAVSDVTAFCTDLATYGTRCAFPTACLNDLKAQCPTTFGLALGPAFTSGFHDCLATVDCTRLG